MDKLRDLMFILSQLEKAEHSSMYQMDCLLSNIGHFFSYYRDAEINATLLTLFEDKFNLKPKIKA